MLAELFHLILLAGPLSNKRDTLTVHLGCDNNVAHPVGCGYNRSVLIEDWRLCVIPTPSGWRALVLWDDGVEVVEEHVCETMCLPLALHT